MDIKAKNGKGQKHTVAPPATHRRWALGYLVVALIAIAGYFAVNYRWFGDAGSYGSLLERLFLALFVISLVLILTKLIEAIVAKRSTTRKMGYNIIRVIHFLSVLAIAFILVSFLFQKWYTAAVSLGLVSLLLGFALQTPISSLIGWVYIITRNPYRVGDRIQVGDFTGDVVEISYLDTTLWEFHGDYLSNDVPSGRLIRFPNTMVLQAEVYNYSWKKFPFIWNELNFHIAYESDFEYVESTIREVAKNELGEDMAANIQRYKDLLAKTPVDELDVKEYPFVVFRTNPNTWIEVAVIYLVNPKRGASVRSRLIKAAVAALLKEPKKVMFPNGNAR